MTLFFDTWPHTPRCADDDVNPDWWIDRDYETVAPNDPDLDRMAVMREQIRSVDQLLVQMRRDQLRAKILCHECPLFDACREAGWNEGYHVWAGLDPIERYKVRKAGSLDILQRPGKDISDYHMEWLTGRFLAGEDADDIAQDLGLSSHTVLNQVRGLLAVRRAARRDEEEKWDLKPPLPLLPNGMSRESYRRGAAVSSISEPIREERMSA